MFRIRVVATVLAPCEEGEHSSSAAQLPDRWVTEQKHGNDVMT